MTKVQSIRSEYGEQFRDVVKGYAKMGYSRTFAAQILGISLSYFRQLCSRFDLHRYFRPQSEMVPESRGVGRPNCKGWPKGKPRVKPCKYSDEELLTMLRRHPDLTYHAFSGLAPVSAATIQRRFGSWSRAKELSHGRT
ncbi:MAG: hypothetical protein WC455_29875 [Dehalococcoidia bacterium]|jgi:hypothetical protein